MKLKKAAPMTLVLSSLILQGCFVYNKDSKVSLSSIINQKNELNASLTSLDVSNNVITIHGANFSKVTEVSLKDGTQTIPLVIQSKTDNLITAKALSALSLLTNESLNLIVSNAEAQSLFPITFTLQDGAVTAAKLHNMGATSGQVLRFNGTNWAPSSLSNSQVYLGTWNAQTNSPDISSLGAFNSGEYFIVTTAGTYNSISYNVGDWVMFNGSSWEKINNSSNVVSSFQGRRGAVTLQASDYVSLKDPTTHKLTGSSLNDLADINLTIPPADGQVLKYDTASGKWIAGNDNFAPSGIALSDLSASSPLVYNNTTGSFSLPTANVLALPLTGLSSASGSVSATDSILGAFGKLMSVPSDYVSKSSGASISTGTIAVSGTAMITVPTATGVTPTEVTNVSYVNNYVSSAIAANGVWNKGASSSINYTAGNVGIGTTSPGQQLEIKSSNPFIAFNTIGSFGGFRFQQNGVDRYTAALNGSGDQIYSRFNSSGIWQNDVLSLKSNGDVAINTNGFLYQNSTGNIGIGTTNPMSKLDLNGDLKVGDLGYTDATAGLIIGKGTTASRLDIVGTGNYQDVLFIKSNAVSTVKNWSFGQRYDSYFGNTSGSFQIVGDKVDGSGVHSVYYVPLIAQPNGNLILAGASSNASNGNVGIGTTSPNAPLHIASSAAGLDLLRIQNTSSSAYSSIGFFDETNSQKGSFGYANAGVGGAYGGKVFFNGNGTDVVFGSAGTANMTIKSNGNVGIGTTSPSYTLHVNGSVAGTSAYNNLSDIRLKKNIEVIPHSLEKLLQVDGVFYNWRVDEFPEKKFSNRREMGVIAQKVEKVFPEAITKDREGIRSVAYSMLIAPLINAVKELYLKITGLEAEVEANKVAMKQAEMKIKNLEEENLKVKEKNQELEARLLKLEKVVKP